MKQTLLYAAAICALPLLLVACQAPAPAQGDARPPPKAAAAPKGVSPTIAEATAAAQAGMPSTQDKLNAHIYRGSGVVVKGQTPGGGVPPTPQAPVSYTHLTLPTNREV